MGISTLPLDNIAIRIESREYSDRMLGYSGIEYLIKLVGCSLFKSI